MKLRIATVLLLLPFAQATQEPFQLDPDPVERPLQQIDSTINTQAITTIDILSSSPNHSTLLHLLQRTKLIPTLNLIQGSTIFAPTDEAWSTWGEAQGGAFHGLLSKDRQADVADNVLFGLRQHLLYHVLNYTLHDVSHLNDSAKSYVTTETTLLFPGRPMMPPSPHKPTGSPWLPQGGDGDLGGAGQHLRIQYVDGQPGGVGCDAFGDGGSTVWDDWPLKKKGGPPSGEPEISAAGKEDGVVRHASNGVVIGIQRVLEAPPTLAQVVSNESELSYLSRLLGDESFISLASDTSLPSFSQSRHLTLFAPSNDAFKRFDHLELKYLESEWGFEAIRRVLAHHLVSTAEEDKIRDVKQIKGVVGWRSAFEGKDGGKGGKPHTTHVLDIDKNPLQIQMKAGEMQVNGTRVTRPDIFASNGVVHVIDTLLLPDDFKLLNSPEKLLLSLNATRFVSLLRMANLSDTYTAKHPDQPYTILAPTDDVLERMDRWGGGWLLERLETALASQLESTPLSTIDHHLADELKEQLLYHILPGKLSLRDLKNGLLLETELVTDRLGGGRQRIAVDVGPHQEKGDGVLAIGDIKIGDGVLTAEPIEIGNSIIYLISTLLEPPSDLIQTAVSDLSLSTFVASTFAAGLDKFVKRAPSKTYFAPQNKAFEELGLVMKYLLLPDAKPDLKKVIRYHMVDEALYLNDIALGQRTLRTVAGEEVFLNRTWRNESNPTNITDAIAIFGPRYRLSNTSTFLPVNGDFVQGELVTGNMLTSTGALHSIDRVLLPASIDITIGKLIAGAKISTMADLLIRAGMGWALTGAQPSTSDFDRLGLTTRATASLVAARNMTNNLLPAYTLLCPTDHAFSQINLTKYRNDEAALLSLLKLHLIPSNPATPVDLSSATSLPPQVGNPLALDEGIVYPTLHSAESKYGDLIMRNVVGDEWIVGVKDARGHSQDHNAGRLLSWGRATPRWARPSIHGNPTNTVAEVTGIDDTLINSTWNGIMTLGGGVLVIDNVLLPYEPSWFFRWGWLAAILSFILLLTTGMIVLGVWYVKVRRARQEAKYEVLEGEEEE